MSQSPVAASTEQVQALQDAGFSREDILALIHAAAIFGWANRLMHTLGHAGKTASPQVSVTNRS
ncbi:carboxymuconolactone decarboxylase family protein [Musicola paradisiaca]|uniref:hypothetical protein n=1 Tax=Musicola paradisiaca TaxID=69223 RepID=UPI0018C9D2CE|nr:hypothetical protein [Musicola paradisiaca]